jgi:DNA-directed RNA polymerase specialized sigma24 family protein
MKEELDGTILYYMSCRESAAERVISDAAASEFHRRHIVALSSHCRRLCRTLGVPVDKASDLASITLAKAIDRAETFIDGTDPSTRTKRTQTWLGTIARNLLRDSLRNPRRSGPVTGNQDEIAFEDYSVEDLASLWCDGVKFPRTLKMIRLIGEAMSSLDTRTMTVLAYTVLERRRSPKGSYMYRGSADALAHRLETTTINIRRIRMLGVRAIDNYVRERTPK